MMTDPIADMLTRIRNAQASGHEQLSLPHSKIKQAIAQILAERGYLSDVKTVRNGAFEQLIVELNGNDIRRLKRVSKPGRRIYAKANQIPRVLGGRGLLIVSTSRGLMTDDQARQAGLGGELICEVQ